VLRFLPLHAFGRGRIRPVALVFARVAGAALLLLGEQPIPAMLLGCLVILLGTALSTGVLKRRPRTTTAPWKTAARGGRRCTGRSPT